jgi:hypothetical protein
MKILLVYLYFFLTFFTGFLLTVLWLKINENKHEVMSRVVGSLALIAPIFTLLFVSIIAINTKETYISNSDWKTIYKNGDEINLEILFEEYFFNKSINNISVNTEENFKEIIKVL